MGKLRNRAAVLALTAVLLAASLAGCNIIGGVLGLSPVADAGYDQNVAVGATVSLDGSNSTGDALKYQWAVKNSPTGASTTISNASKANASFTPLVQGIYTIQLTVTNTYGSDKTTITITANGIANGPAPPVANGPAPPTSITFSNVTNNSIGISWSPSTGATKYYLYRDTSSTGSFAYTVTSGNNLSTTDTAVSPGTIYWYSVQAQNNSGFGAVSTAFQVTSATTASAPPSPQGLVVGGATSSSLTLTWNSVSSATSYKVYRLESASGTVGNFTSVASPTSNSYTDTSLAQTTTFHYTVSAVNGAGESAQSSPQFATTLHTGDTAVPGIVSWASTPITNIGTNSLSLNWTSVTGATSYVLYRDTNVNGFFNTTLAEVTNLTYTDATVGSGNTYYYKIAAKNASGLGLLSSAVYATTVALASPPSSPSNLTPANGATGIDPSLPISFIWSSSTDSSQGATITYELRGGSSPSTATTQTSGLTGTTYVFPANSIPYSTTGWWQVIAHSSTGLTSASQFTSFTTMAPPANAVLPPVINSANASSTPSTNTYINQSLANTTFYLMVSAYDPASYGLSYSWSLTGAPAGSTASISSPNSATASFTPATAGTYYFKITVTSSAGKVSNTNFVVTVTSGGGYSYGIQ